MTDRLTRTLEHLETLHAADPKRVEVDGEPVAAELAWARRVGAWVTRLQPQASAALRLAASCQHLERWTLPRSAYPSGREGYLAWRREQGRRQGERARETLAACGWDAETAARVASLVRKEGLGRDPETRALEDAACLAFLELELGAFAADRDAEEVARILRRTWRKMSSAGREAALELQLPEPAGRLLERALQDAET